MGKLIVQMHISIDGFVGADPRAGDPVGHQGFGVTDEAATRWIVDSTRQSGAHLMGSRTFHNMAAHWPTSTEPFAAPMNEIPKVVFSTRKNFDAATAAGATTMTSWTQARVARGDLAEEIGKLKAETEKPLIAFGGAEFCRSLVAERLVDEFRLILRPLALGKGMPLFSGLARPLALSLVSSTRFESGIVANVYQPAGK